LILDGVTAAAPKGGEVLRVERGGVVVSRDGTLTGRVDVREGGVRRPVGANQDPQAALADAMAERDALEETRQLHLTLSKNACAGLLECMEQNGVVGSVRVDVRVNVDEAGAATKVTSTLH